MGWVLLSFARAIPCATHHQSLIGALWPQVPPPPPSAGKQLLRRLKESKNVGQVSCLPHQNACILQQFQQMQIFHVLRDIYFPLERPVVFKTRTHKLILSCSVWISFPTCALGYWLWRRTINSAIFSYSLPRYTKTLFYKGTRAHLLWYQIKKFWSRRLHDNWCWVK